MILTEKELLKELFAIPINPKLVAVLDKKLKLYSSNNLITKFKSSLAKTPSSASSYKFLSNMIDKQILTPVYLSKSILAYPFIKIFGNDSIKEMKGIKAFYDSNVNRIFILIDSNTKFGFASDKWIGRLTIHECIHMAAAHGRKKFLNLYYNEFSHFYNVFFHILVDKKMTSASSRMIANDIDEYIKVFFAAEVFGKDLQSTVYKDGYAIFHSIMKKFDVDKKVIKIIQEGYKKLITLFANYQYTGIKRALEDPACHFIMACLQKTYPAISNNNPNTFAIQELIFPSEIAAVFSEIFVSKGKIPKAISMIKVK